jgi:hypothetical protein
MFHTYYSDEIDSTAKRWNYTSFLALYLSYMEPAQECGIVQGTDAKQCTKIREVRFDAAERQSRDHTLVK